VNRQKGWFYELDVRSKLILSICVTALVFLWADPRYLAGLVVVLMILSLSAGMGAKATMKPFLYLLPFALAIVLIHALFNDAGKNRSFGSGTGTYSLTGRPFRVKKRKALSMGLPWHSGCLHWYSFFRLSYLRVLRAGSSLGLVRSGVPYTIAFVVAQRNAVYTAPFGRSSRKLPVDSANILTKARVYSRIAVPPHSGCGGEIPANRAGASGQRFHWEQ
jgi:energy-coupling factor transporter transmembrane protein EcfT